jgi:hypothetical protein
MVARLMLRAQEPAPSLVVLSGYFMRGGFGYNVVASCLSFT